MPTSTIGKGISTNYGDNLDDDDVGDDGARRLLAVSWVEACPAPFFLLNTMSGVVKKSVNGGSADTRALVSATSLEQIAKTIARVFAEPPLTDFVDLNEITKVERSTQVAPQEKASTRVLHRACVCADCFVWAPAKAGNVYIYM